MENAINTVSETIEKATKILRARLPKLSENGLNFEKRTGNFFKASTSIDSFGAERVSRLVVAEEELPEVCADEIAAKRAAAVVMSADSQTAKLDKVIKEATAALEEAKAAREAFDTMLGDAIDTVEVFELPEKQMSQAAHLKSKVAEQEAEIQRLREMLAAAGVTE